MLSGLPVAEDVGHVAYQSEVFLEADLAIVVFIQASLHLFNGGAAVCVLQQAEANMWPSDGRSGCGMMIYLYLQDVSEV